MFPATFLNFGPACSAIFLLWSFGEINQLELSIYLDIYALKAGPKLKKWWETCHCYLITIRLEIYVLGPPNLCSVNGWTTPVNKAAALKFLSKLVHLFRSYSSFSKTQADTQKQCDPISSKFCYICLFLAGINQFLSHWTLRPSSATFSHNFTVTRFNQYDR